MTNTDILTQAEQVTSLEGQAAMSFMEALRSGLIHDEAVQQMADTARDESHFWEMLVAYLPGFLPDWHKGMMRAFDHIAFTLETEPQKVRDMVHAQDLHGKLIKAARA